MSRNHKVPALLLTALFFAAAGLVPVESSLFKLWPFPAVTLSAAEYSAQDPGDDEAMPFPAPRSKQKTARRKSRASEKGASKKADTAAKKKDAETPANASDTTELKFSQDIAPILAKNCSGCHSGNGQGLRKGKLELTSFDKLLKGTTTNKQVVIPGKPEESSLVLRIKGEEAPRMPQGNNVLSDDAIAKIERWVKAGAKLDQGIDAKAAMDSYAATPEQVLRRGLAKLSPQERDKKVKEVGLARWKQADAKVKPEIASGDHFIMFSSLPGERTTKDLKILDKQYTHLKNLLGSPTMDWVEKVSLFVFTRRSDFIEFVRTVESREVEADAVSSAKLSGAQPYVAIVDPLGGKKEEPAAKRKTRAKRGEEKDGSASDRSLAGLLTEALGSAAVASAGEPPRWLKQGIGTYLASQVEPRSQYYHQLRQNAFAKFQQGWESKATETLGGTDKIAADDFHAVSFALVESMLASELRQGFPTFVNGMLGGAGKLDEMLRKVYEYAGREDFLVDTGDFVATRYGRDQ
jgi:mono/diheme cytochrome c family protein